MPRISAFHSITNVLGALLAVSLLYGAAPSAAENPIVLTQIPVRGKLAAIIPAAGILPAERARVAVVNPDGSVRVLTQAFHSACDPEVSFDGKRILFSGKRHAQDLWDIFEMTLEGKDLRQVTRNMGNCRNPVYLSQLYTLVSDKPWHQIAFLSDQSAGLDEHGTATGFNMYSTRLDGTARLRLTALPSGVMDPFLTLDGRLLVSVSRRRQPDAPRSAGIFGLNIDGTDFALFAGNEGRDVKRMPCVTTGGLAVFVEQEKGAQDAGGVLACVSLRRNHHSYRQVTQTGDGAFLYPAPLPDGRVLVSRRPQAGGGSYAAYAVDPESGKCAQVFDDPAFHELQARIVAPRPEPDGRSTSVLRRTGEIEDPFALEKGASGKPVEMPMGKLYGLNVYISNFVKAGSMPAGTVRRARFLEGIPRSSADLGGTRRSPHGARTMAAAPLPPIQRRLLGEAPVEEDGSFNVQVPADIPVEIQLLDADGMALQSCGWLWVKNNEPRGCIGCHEDPELVPENHMVKAITKPSVLLTLPPERRRTVDYVRHVKPIIETRCLGCHGAGGSQPRLDGAGADAGFALLAAHHVTPGRARTSPLIWHIFGRNTARPWDRTQPGKAAPIPAHGPSLNEDEKRVFIEWIDMGASLGSVPAPPTSTARK